MTKSWEQILGGYATDTLTEEEKRQLFEAALQDQPLFEALADEEALKALLANPDARQRILASLQASENSPETGNTSRPSLSWFRQPSFLAWAGSIAAMGLALIFGWQMKKDWGPLVEQEQYMEGSVSKDQDSENNEEILRSEDSEAIAMKEQVLDPQENDQSQPKRVAGISTSVSSPQESIKTKASKSAEGMRQSSAQGCSESLPQPIAKTERRMKAHESLSQSPLSAIVQSVQEKEQRGEPTLASPGVTEKGNKQLARTPSFADKLARRDSISSPSAREIYFAKKSRQVDAVGEELDGRRAKQFRGGRSPQVTKALTEENQDLKKSQEADLNYSQSQSRGIRYGFVRRAADDKTEAVDIKQFTGRWADLHLTLESNVSGHLYVLASVGKGKWQQVRPESENMKVLSDEARRVNGYQAMDFALSQVTDILDKPGMSSITVLLSSTPLTDLGKWVVGGGGPKPTEETLTEHSAREVFVLDQDASSSRPFRVEILLGE